MTTLNILTGIFNRLTVHSTAKTFTRNIAINNSLYFKISPCLFAEPLKKKKRMDPAVIKAREERKKKKIERQIRRLERNARQLKPLEECEIPLSLLDEKKHRLREIPNLSNDGIESRATLQKKWAAFKLTQHLADIKMLDRIAYAQQKSLDELRQESEELYQEAIQTDFTLLPFKSEGPVETPNIENYDSPDGEYVDVSKKWE